MINLKKSAQLSAVSLALLTSINSSADVQHLDDVIISFSACIGNDCVNGESFGFDTIRIKENNLRIHAQDTSTSASFPTNDWRLVFNDSSNGGGNYFAVEDSDAGRTPFKVEAGAPANSLYVEDGGRVGFGTATPVVDLHVKSGNTPTLRLEQDGSNGFTAQTWDIAGNEAGFFIRDATNSSTLPFRIRPGASSSVIDISADDEVGINTTSPDAMLDVIGSTGVLIRPTDTGAVTTSSLLNVVGGISAENINITPSGTTLDNNTSFVTFTNNDPLEDDQLMLELVNPNGDVRLHFVDKTSGVTWRVTSNDGGFSITKIGSGETEFSIDSDGNVTIAKDLTVTGTIHGTVVTP